MEDNKDDMGGKLSKKGKRDAGVGAERAVHDIAELSADEWSVFLPPQTPKVNHIV